jgi:hypothetical protein
MHNRLWRLALMAAVLAAGLGARAAAGVPGAAAQGTTTFFITNVNADNFPTVTFDLRAVDLSNQVVTNLNSGSVSVYENGQLVPQEFVQVTPDPEGPMTVVFAIDLGRQSRFQAIGVNNTKQAITTLISGGYFRDERDTFQVMARQNVGNDQTIVLWPASSKGEDLVSWTASFPFNRSSSNTRGLLVVEDAINAMDGLVGIPGSETAAIVYLARYIEDPNQLGSTGATAATSAANSLAQAAREKYITIHTLQFDSTGQLMGPFQALSAGANGIHATVQGSNVVAAATTMYQAIDAQRIIYHVTYRSQLGAAGTRVITLNAPTPPENGVTGEYTLQQVGGATLRITQPAAGSTLRREATLGTGGAYTYDLNRVAVAVEVSWPAGVAARGLTSAQLFVDGQLEDEVTPAEGATQLSFDWDITDVVAPGENQVQLKVVVMDELQVPAEASATVFVDVVPPPEPTPAPTEVPESPMATALREYGVWGLGALLCAGAGLVVLVGAVLLLRPRRQPQLAPAAAGPGARAGGRAGPDHTMVVGGGGPGGALATLTVLEGPRGMMGETINLTKPVSVLGRNPEMADVVFYPDENSSLSRAHATIQLDGKFFVLTDNGSTNGTRVNGQLLKASDPVQLRDGDEIVLGDLGKLGVKMRFNTVAAGSSQTDIRDRTFIVDDYDQQDWDKFKEG